ncbi:hypothetical protein [Microbacterium sp. B19]|uniref:hypothetical protein n=1 Tax=Microbacterium sp. B19 TaxID=96765 RepID=UPI0006845F27|nr:hypothetical protein [Microbacterium sp. B19]
MDRLHTFVYELPDGSRTTVSRIPSSAERTLRRLVSLMGEDQSTLCVWQMPDGADLFDLDRTEWPRVFLRAAGIADAMTIEWRRVDQDGVERLYTVGRGTQRPGEPVVAIEFLGRTGRAPVEPDEIFTAGEAGEIFVHYLHTLAVPHHCVLRQSQGSAMTSANPTFVYEVNGASFANLPNSPRSYEENLRRMLSLVGEPGRSTFALSKLPDGRSIWDVTRETLPSVFLQAAGTAEAMTIEWRRLDEDGVERLCSVGHGGHRENEPTVVIDFFEGTARAVVFPDEVFTADEAGEVFVHYFHTLAVPDRYVLREVDLTPPIP